MKQLRKCFKAQTIKDFEHIIVYDGVPPNDVRDFLLAEDVIFDYLPVKDNRYGTAPRNRGIELASGEFIIFADDDDYYHINYLKAFLDLSPDNESLCVVKMDDYGRIIPGAPLHLFPRGCDIGTPQCCFPSIWLNNPGIRWGWKGDYAHDYQFISLCITTFKPKIKISSCVVVAARNVGRLKKEGLSDTLPFQYR